MLDQAFFKESNLSYFNTSREANKKSNPAQQNLDESIVEPAGKELIEAEQAMLDQFNANLLSI